MASASGLFSQITDAVSTNRELKTRVEAVDVNLDRVRKIIRAQERQKMQLKSSLERAVLSRSKARAELSNLRDQTALIEAAVRAGRHNVEALEGRIRQYESAVDQSRRAFVTKVALARDLAIAIDPEGLGTLGRLQKEAADLKSTVRVEALAVAARSARLEVEAALEPPPLQEEEHDEDDENAQLHSQILHAQQEIEDAKLDRDMLRAALAA